jgi:hypothetical protein
VSFFVGSTPLQRLLGLDEQVPPRLWAAASISDQGGCFPFDRRLLPFRRRLLLPFRPVVASSALDLKGESCLVPLLLPAAAGSALRRPVASYLALPCCVARFFAPPCCLALPCCCLTLHSICLELYWVVRCYRKVQSGSLSICNVTERSFALWKNKWQILYKMPKYSMLEKKDCCWHYHPPQLHSWAF